MLNEPEGLSYVSSYETVTVVVVEGAAMAAEAAKTRVLMTVMNFMIG